MYKWLCNDASPIEVRGNYENIQSENSLKQLANTSIINSTDVGYALINRLSYNERVHYFRITAVREEI